MWGIQFSSEFEEFDFFPSPTPAQDQQQTKLRVCRERAEQRRLRAFLNFECAEDKRHYRYTH